MTTRRDSTLLRPDDTVLLDEHDRPRIVAALMALPADEPVLAEAVDSARRLDGELDPLVTAVMTARCVGVAPLIGAGQLIGIVTATDLVRSPATGPHTRPGAR
jgi:CBS domain-containing protein